MRFADLLSGGQPLQQIGVAGVLVILVLDRVFAFVSKWRAESRDQKPADPAFEAAYWRESNKKGVLEALEAAIIPIMRQQADILNRMEARSAAIHEMTLRHGITLEDVQRSMDRLRASTHQTNSDIQKIVGHVGGAQP